MDFSGWNLDMGSVAAFLMLGVVIPAFLLALAFFQPNRRQMERWAAVCGVTLTDTNRDQVRTHLARGRRLRSVAAFPFWWLGSISMVYAPFPRAVATPAPAIAAYLAGALLAEVTGGRLRTPAAAERRAPLLTRTLKDYAPGWIRMLPYVLVAIGVASVGLDRVLHGPDLDAKAAVMVALATLFTAGAVLVSSKIVRRPQRGSEQDVLAADDALRATGISTALAAGSLSGLVAAATGAGSLVPEETNAWWLLLLIPGSLVSQAVTIGGLALVVRQETWGYRRRHRQAKATATEAVSA